ncbi:uncharacterized protein LOC134833546 isoform X2 [Culicoides brevitarsis]|uniref:uncharacterized protein LOC134833546 isoform X2 n=1 Tax=Culicoides brevitarsis TaxID=469753 RepID=UPI00307CB8E0
MCHILQLNHDELEMIFKKLSRHDRLKCKEVCKKWYEYFMEPLNFREDRTIYLTNESRVGKMVSTLAAAKGSYEKLVVVELNKTKKFTKLGKCLRKNGIKEVCFKSFNPTYYDLLPKLTFVESLSIESYYFPKFCKISSKNVYFRNLKKITIVIIHGFCFGEWNGMSELPALRKMIPKDVVIHFKVRYLDDPKWLPNFNEAMKALNVHFELIQAILIIGYSSLEREQLLEFSKCGLQQFIIHCPERLPMKFEELLNNMENLRELRIYGIKDISILRELSAKNLTKITELCIRDAICKSNHDSFSFPSLLELNIKNCQCKKCFETILDSRMPKLREITIDKPPSPVILRQWENLESVKLIELNEFDLTKIFQNCLPSLRKFLVLEFELETLELSVEAIKRIDKLCPKLETFELITYELHDIQVNVSPSLEYLGNALTNGFKNLKMFRVTGNEGWSQLQLTKKDGVVNYCNFKDDLNVNNAKRRRTEN